MAKKIFSFFQPLTLSILETRPVGGTPTPAVVSDWRLPQRVAKVRKMFYFPSADAGFFSSSRLPCRPPQPSLEG
ncbi:hypothetical protein, partial [Rufibacter sp. LB8]